MILLVVSFVGMIKYGILKYEHVNWCLQSIRLKESSSNYIHMLSCGDRYCHEYLYFIFLQKQQYDRKKDEVALR